MGIKYDVIEIRRSELTTIRKAVPKWETPVLQAVWGNSVNVISETVRDVRVPDAGDEFARLSARYGPRNGDTPFIAAVYGNFGPGVNALRREIEGAITQERDTRQPAPTVEEQKQAEKGFTAPPQDSVASGNSEIKPPGENPDDQADKVNEVNESDDEDNADAVGDSEGDARDLGIA